MIEVKNINKKYGRSIILDNISFEINKGDCVGILGGNGAGKSTLLSILAGTIKANSGEFIINGKNALKDNKIIRELIGYCPQDNPLIEELTVLDNLKLWYCNSVVGLDEELENGVLNRLDVHKMLRKNVKALSGGMKKRLSLSIALANHPPILILDEPGTALDLACKKDINDYIKHYLSLGGTVIISTHDEAEIRLCNKLFIMNNGSLKIINPDTSIDEVTSIIKKGATLWTRKIKTNL